MDTIARVRSAAKLLMTLLGIRLGLVLVGMIVFRVLNAVTTDFQVFQIAGTVWDGLEGLASFAVFVVYLVWLARTYRAIAAKGGTTSMGAGLAIWGWFIPLGNFVLPWLGLRSAWRGARPDSSALVGAWWIAYVLMTLGNITQSLFTSGTLIPSEGMATVLNAVGWSGLVLVFATYGLWMAIVSKITGAIAGTSAAATPGRLAHAGA